MTGRQLEILKEILINNNYLMTILFSVPRGILLTSYLGPKSKEKSVLPGIWIGSWLFIPKDRNDYWLVLINDLAL